MAKEKKEAPAKPEFLKIRFLLSPTGKFGLAYNVGDVAEIEVKQADELVQAEYAEYVK